MLAEQTIGAVRQEVQAVKSGEAVIADTIEGRAPVQYAALKPHPPACKSSTTPRS